MTSTSPAVTPARRGIARAVSIIGHPFLVMPLAGLAAAQARGAPPTMLWPLAGALAVLVLGLQAWTVRQVRRGRWAHVDASGGSERRDLNRALLAVFAAGAVIGLALRAPRELLLAFVLSAAMVALALLLARRLTLSLHVAFAVFAAAVVGTWPLALGLLALAVAVAWSRLVLARHSGADVALGALAGGLAGLAFAFAQQARIPGATT